MSDGYVGIGSQLLQACGDKACLDAVLHKSHSALNVLHRRSAGGTLSPEVGVSVIGNLEEHINNLHADVELAQQRYEKFCRANTGIHKSQ
jgi:hypothetical protein